MKKTGLLLIVCLITILAFTDTASAQSSWGGAMNVGVNQHFSGNAGFHSSVDLTVANGFTLSVGGSVTGNGYTLYKRGGGRFWFMADNMNFDGDIVYLGKSDTVRLDGVFGALVNDSVGYVHTGKIFSSSDSISFFHLHQHDTVVQTFNAHGYNRTNTNLYLYSDTRSTLRLVQSSDDLAGTVHLSAGGTLYIDGTYDAKILVADSGLLITGENSVASHCDYATFANRIANDTALIVSRVSTLQIGSRNSPSLANVVKGHLVQRDGSTLEIDVYDPQASWNLTAGIHTNWKSLSDSSFSDRIYLADGDYFFGADSKIRLNFDTGFVDSVVSDTVFYLPVIMLNTSLHQISGASNVIVNQNLAGWHLGFFIGDGNNNTVNGWGYIKGKSVLPDNIVDADCYGKPVSTQWSFKLLAESTQEVSAVSGVYAGDMDGDGHVEILALEFPAGGNEYSNAQYMYIFDDNLNVKYTIDLGSQLANLLANSISVADVNGDGKAEIFLCTTDGYLRKYSWNGSNNFSTMTSVQHTANSDYYYCQPMIVDFNGDGIPEVVALDKIYNAQTLVLLVDGSMKGTGNLGMGSGHITTDTYSPNKSPCMTVAGDIDNDGIPEILAGATAYKVTITNSGGTSDNKFEVFKQANASGRSEVGDGATAIADMDLDGYLDVIVSRRTGGAAAAIFIWNPRTGAIMNTNPVTGLFVHPEPFGPSIPFIGDLDGDGKPEIVVVSHNDGTTTQTATAGRVTAFDFEGGVMSEKWHITNSDYSAATGITLFDFNQDGSSELVYRDITYLRVLNGADGSDKITLAVCSSSTGMEYPVVVDYNNDGAAEIIIAGASVTGSFNPNTGGKLRAYGSDGDPWAPARKVWNQYQYNAVNVNEDLRIPRYPLNPATVFPNGKRPYNNFLQQQTTLNINGDPLWLLPDFVLTGTPNTHCYAAGDSLVISNLCVRNDGDARGGDNIQIAVYRNSRAALNLIAVYSMPAGIDVGTTRYYSIKLTGASLFSTANLLIEVNDDGNATHPQDECLYDNNGTTIAFASVPRARNDRIQVFACSSKTVDVLANDIGFIGGNTPVITKDGTLGTATLSGTKIVYANDKAVSGGCTTHGGKRDTVIYTVCYGANCSSASLFVDILRMPSIRLFDSCSRRPWMTLNYQYPQAAYKWYTSLDGAPDSWTEIPGSQQMKLYITADAWYKCEITWKGETYETTPAHFIVRRKFRLPPGNVWWYETGLIEN